MSVIVERNGPVWTVILDRPDVRNAVDGPTAVRLGDAFRAFDADQTAHVAVLWGAGGTFCSGADLKALGTDRSNTVTPDGDGPMGPTRMALTKPVIAAISGHAVAGGLELACWCDLRIVEEDATLGVFCRRWGVPLIDGGTVRLSQLIGQSRAMDWILTGRPIDAAEALHAGFAHRVVPTGSARAQAERLAAHLAEFPQHTLRADRQSLLASQGLSTDDAMQQELAFGMEALEQGEALSGAAAFRDGAGRHGIGSTLD